MIKNKDSIKTTKITLFKGKKIRKTIYKNEWWFSVTDVVEVLTGSTDIKQYIKKMRQRDQELDSCWGTICTPLEILAPDGKMRKSNCTNTEGVFRIIQSIPSRKAEPFKRWLAKVGYERVKEIEDPELATKRTRMLYKAKGYSEAWIEKQMRGIEVRETLTSEWKERGVQEGREYQILTAEISKATFGMTPSKCKKHKALKRENLRDHMTDLELIFTMLGEASTTEIAQNKDAQGFNKNKDAAKKGGKIAGDAREKLEKESGKQVSTSNNYLNQPENKKISE